MDHKPQSMGPATLQASLNPETLNAQVANKAKGSKELLRGGGGGAEEEEAEEELPIAVVKKRNEGMQDFNPNPLNLTPHTLDPDPITPNPAPYILGPKAQTVNPTP